MRGYYIYCRAWTNFSETFPWFDELNPFPDDQLCSELNIRALNWLRENRPAAKQRYREERRKLKNIACESQTLCRGSVVRGMPNMPSSRELEIRAYLAILDRTTLLKEATCYGIQLALPVSELIEAIVSAKKMEFSEREYERQRLKDRRSAEQIRDLPDVRKQVRGDRKKSCLGTRIARVAGWLTEDTRSFGRKSPTPKLMLKWVATKNELHELLAVARARFDEPNWGLAMLRFGSLSCGELSAPELVLLKRKSDNHLRPDSRWTGTPLFQAILHEFHKVAQDLANTKTLCQTNLPGTGSDKGIGGDPPAAEGEGEGIAGSGDAAERAPEEELPPARHSPSGGMSWQDAKDKAVQHVKRCGYPGLNALARLVGCSRSTMHKAVRRSSYLNARKAEYEAGRKGQLRKRPMTDVLVDNVQQTTEADPADEAETLDELIAEQDADDNDPDPLGSTSRHRSR